MEHIQAMDLHCLYGLTNLALIIAQVNLPAPANQPFKTNIQNSLPGIEFNGTSMNLLGTLPTVALRSQYHRLLRLYDHLICSYKCFFLVWVLFDAVPDSIGFAKNAGVNYFNVFTWEATEARFSPDTSDPIVFVGEETSL